MLALQMLQTQKLDKSIATIEFFKNKKLQRSPFTHESEMKEQGTDGEKMVTLGEVLNLATPRGATMFFYANIFIYYFANLKLYSI